jgi:hypothetical protein
MSVINGVSAQIEVVSKKTEQYLDKSDALHSLIKKAGGDDGIEVSRRLYRIPYKRWRAGVLGKHDNDGGALPTGNAPSFSHLTAGYYTFALAYRITQEMIDTMESSDKSRVNIVSDVTSEAISEMNVMLDTMLHTDGTGRLTNAASATNGTTTLTFADPTDTLGVARLRPGMSVDVWDSAGANKRAGGPHQIIAIDGNVVTFGAAIVGIQATDLIAFYNMDAYGPATLTSFTALWPGAGLTNGPGLTGDSFVHGIAYANDATGTNNYLGRLKSTFPELKAVRVNAASSALVFQHGLLGIHGLQQKRGSDAQKGLVGIFPGAQRAQVFNIGIAISEWNRGASDKMIDVMPSNTGYGEKFTFCGIPCIVSNRQDSCRVDFVNPKNFRRVQTKPVGFRKAPGGGYLHPVYTNPAGTAVSTATAYDIFVEAALDYCSLDPGAGVVVDSLTRPTGF